MPEEVCSICGGKARNEKRDFECTTPDGIHHVVKDVPMEVCLTGCKESSLDSEAVRMIGRAIKQSYSPQ